jgi:hypothetical protein
MNRAHQTLLNQIKLFLAPFGLVYSQDTPGLAYDRNGNPFKAGLKGAADLIAILKPTGRALAVEVKTGTGKLSTAQRNYGLAVERAGGIFVCARSVDDVADRLRQEGFEL